MNELIVAGRALVSTDGPELIDAALGLQLAEINQEIQSVESLIDGTERSIANALNMLCWRYPELSSRFREKYNTFQELRGDPKVAKDRDPATRKNKDGMSEMDEAALAEKEAEDAAKAALSKDDSELTPSQQRSKLAIRIKREKCRKFYLKIAQKTHPDKVKDKELNDIFINAKKAYDALDLPELREMFTDLQGYLKLRGKKGNFRRYRMRRLEVSRTYLADRKKDFKQLTGGSAYDCVKAMESGGPDEIRAAYQDYVEDQLFQLDEAISSLRAQMRVQRRTTMPADLKAKLMAGLMFD